MVKNSICWRKSAPAVADPRLGSHPDQPRCDFKLGQTLQGRRRQLESLYPKDRLDKRKSRAIDACTAANLIAVRKTMPAATVPALIQVMAKRLLISADTRLTPSAVYRFLHNHQKKKQGGRLTHLKIGDWQWML